MAVCRQRPLRLSAVRAEEAEIVDYPAEDLQGVLGRLMRGVRNS